MKAKSLPESFYNMYNVLISLDKLTYVSCQDVATLFVDECVESKQKFWLLSMVMFTERQPGKAP